MVRLKRFLRHLFTPPWAWRRAFPAAVLDAIETAIRQSEATHTGEIAFAIENALAPGQVWRGITDRERALQVFSALRVWDTAANNGVLIYVLLADRDIEIVADRGLAARVAPAEWEAVAQAMEAEFRAGRFEAGALAGVARVGELLARHCPATGGGAALGDNPDELANRPVIL
ncbi:MAG: TPM domain-containing protein [Pseudomonadota bacterium]